MPEPHDTDRDVRPRPDPTVLTTEQSDRLRAEMLREVQRVETLLRTEQEAATRLNDERFQGIEEKRTETKADTKEALDKVEVGLAKLDEARRRDIEEIKERLGRIEGSYVDRESFNSRMSVIEGGYIGGESGGNRLRPGG